MLSLPSPTCVNLAKVFPTLRFLGCCYVVVEHYRSIVQERQWRNPNPVWVGCCHLLPLTLQALFHFMDPCTSLVLPVSRVVSESCMDVFCSPLPSCISS